MNIISRKEAKLLSSKTYFTGEPCVNGHISYRYTTSGSCAECINGPKSLSPERSMVREAKSNFIKHYFRIYACDFDTFKMAVWGCAAMRYPFLVPADVMCNLAPKNQAAGTGMYAFLCHPDDVTTLQGVVASLLAARPAHIDREAILQANLRAGLA